MKRCSNGACIKKTLLCDFSDDCGDNSDESVCSSYLARCNFEKDLCTWQQQTDDEFNWTRRKGQTPSVSTGPARDHTLGTQAGKNSNPRYRASVNLLKKMLLLPTGGKSNKEEGNDHKKQPVFEYCLRKSTCSGNCC